MPTLLRRSNSASLPRPNEKGRIVQHYDVASPYYRSLWGEHIHHGYWIRGDESKEEAQLQLTELLANLAQLAHLPPSAEILDIGCGFGGSSIHLAQKYAARVTGITISPVQIEMAREAAAAAKANARFLLMDAEALNFQQRFDCFWSVESISHYYDRRAFFLNAVRFLKPGGFFALTDWFKRPGLSALQFRKFIQPIERGMFVELDTMDDYASYLAAAGLEVIHRQDISQNCARTWDLTSEIIRDKSLWALAAAKGKDFLTYLNAFRAMRAGYRSGAFVYGLFVARACRS